jgi:PKHD-type hydroxylase
MQYLFDIPILSNFSTWAFYLEAFSSEECDKIRAMFRDPMTAVVGSEGQSLPHVRKSSVCWIENSGENLWLFDKLSNFALGCNISRYAFNLTGFNEKLQLGKYGPEDHYSWHQDIGGAEMSRRKLSIVLQLSDPSEYEGGELEFCGVDEKAQKGKGDLIIFPSYMSHRVTPITKGERYSLVAWISGPPYA